MQQIKSRILFDNSKFLYLVFYAVFLTLNKFVFFQSVPHTIISMCYNLLALGGIALLAIDFFTRRDLFRVPGNSVLFLYLIVMLLSVIANAGCGILSNLKTLVWSVIQMFLLCSSCWGVDREICKKRFSIILHILSFIWLIGTICSFVEFAAGYSGTYTLSDGGIRKRGFVEGRLYGEFTDPNLAAVFSICIIILMTLDLISHKRSIPMKVYSVINIIFQAIYIILSNSRTALVISAVCCLTGVILILPIWLSRYHWHTFVKSICVITAGIAASAALLGTMQLLKNTLILLPRKSPAIIQQIENLISGENTQHSVESEGDLTDASGNKEHGDDQEISMDRPDTAEDRDISNNRFKIWSGYLDVFQCVPILGTSPRNALAVAKEHLPESSYILQKQYSVHNGYLSVLVCTGIVGAAVVAAWIVFVLKYVFGYLIRKFNARGDYYRVIVAFSLTELALAISAFFMMGIFFGNSILEFLFWYLVGSMLCIIRKDSPELFKKEPLTYRLSEKIFRKRKSL